MLILKGAIGTTCKYQAALAKQLKLYQKTLLEYTLKSMYAMCSSRHSKCFKQGLLCLTLEQNHG